MRNTNPSESMEVEGLPDLEDHPPGIDVELDEDSLMVPRSDGGADQVRTRLAAERERLTTLRDEGRESLAGESESASLGELSSADSTPG